MATFLSLYNEIEYKIKKSAILLEKYRSDIKLLIEENEAIKKENKKLSNEILDLNEKLYLTTLTNTLLKKEDKKDIEKQINSLVREIDNSIKLLKQQNE